MNVFFPVSLNLTDRPCVVIGDDREAVEKEAALREAGARVRWIKNADDVRDADVAEAFFVISTPQDERLSARLRTLADRHRVLLCCIDQPKFGFVAMAAIVKAGYVRIAISTTGLAPRVGKILKESLQRALDATFVRFIDCEATQKERNRRKYPDSSAKRRQAMIASAEGFEAHVALNYPTWFTEREALLHPKHVE